MCARVFVCDGHTCHSVHAEVRGQFAGVSSFCPLWVLEIQLLWFIWWCLFLLSHLANSPLNDKNNSYLSTCKFLQLSFYLDSISSLPCTNLISSFSVFAPYISFLPSLHRLDPPVQFLITTWPLVLNAFSSSPRGLPKGSLWHWWHFLLITGCSRFIFDTHTQKLWNQIDGFLHH